MPGPNVIGPADVVFYDVIDSFTDAFNADKISRLKPVPVNRQYIGLSEYLIDIRFTAVLVADDVGKP